MAVSAKTYLWAYKHAFNGDIDFVNDTIKIALTTSSYTPNQDTHDYFDDVTNEVSGTGYTAGGATLATKAINLDTANNTIELDAADVTWGTSTITARYAVVYKDTGTASTSPLISYIDFGTDESSVAADFTITFHTDGIVQITAA